MTRLVQRLFVIVTAAVLAACAHSVSLAPDTAVLAGQGKGRIDRSAALVMPAELLTREVTSPGGGGDKVNYLPYRDLETGLYVALGEVFARVTKVSGPNDPKVAADGVHWLVTPTIGTTSYSPSLLTWPPTIFTVEITCAITDPQGKSVAEVRSKGEGRAEFDEFKSNFSLSAKRASEDALKKLVPALEAVKDKLQ